MKNKVKYDSYKIGFRILNEVKTKKDLTHCIAAIAIAESIIADRALSYLSFKEIEWLNNKKKKDLTKIGTTDLILKCKSCIPNTSLSIKSNRNGIEIKTNDLFGDIKIWLEKRNSIIHGLCKSLPGTNTINTVQFLHNAIETAECGLKYSELISKWNKEEKKLSKKK